MKLSIVMVFCDNDYKYVEKKIEEIFKKVYIEHELILVDNRDKFKNEIINLNSCENIKMIDMNGNKYQFQARIKSVEYCNGDYVWFIDPDDKILNIEQNILDGEDIADIYYFNYYKATEKVTPFKSISYGVKEINGENIVDYFKKINGGLWSCWISKKILENVTNNGLYLPNDEKLYILEDTIIEQMCLAMSKKIDLINKDIYIFVNYNATSENKKPTVEGFLRLYTGLNKISLYLDKIYIYAVSELAASIEELSKFKNYLISCIYERMIEAFLTQKEKRLTDEEIELVLKNKTAIIEVICEFNNNKNYCIEKVENLIIKYIDDYVYNNKYDYLRLSFFITNILNERVSESFENYSKDKILTIKFLKNYIEKNKTAINNLDLKQRENEKLFFSQMDLRYY